MSAHAMDQESIPDVSTMSEHRLRRLYQHMRENFPGTLMAALIEIDSGGDDVASHKTEKTSNTRASYERRLRKEAAEQLNTITDDEVPAVPLKRNVSDTDGGDLPPSVPTRPEAEVTAAQETTTTPEAPNVEPSSSSDDVVPPIPALITSASKQMSSGDLQPSIPTRKYEPTLTPCAEKEEGCYLLYDSDGGKLMLHYNATQVPNALGFWSAGPNHKIPAFKFKQNLGRSELIGNCQSGVAGRKNFYSGWCQFIRAARAFHGCVTVIPPKEQKNGLPVDIFLYLEDNGIRTLKLKENAPFDVTETTVAVACLPKHTTFYEGVKIDLNKWMNEANAAGAASRFS